MDTKKYAAFVKIAELGSLTRAAEALGLTQSGMSHILASLESELGFTLLIRSRVGARLTPEGEQILPYLTDLLRQEEQMRKAAAEILGASCGEVRIGAFTSVATHWLPSMMQEFQYDYPNVRFRLFNGDYHDVGSWLADGSIDVGFIDLSSEQRYECIPLREDPLMAVLPEGHPLAASKVCRLADFVDQPFISLLESSDQDSRRALENADVKPTIKFTTKDDYAIIAMVRQGLGVSILPQLLLRGHEEGIAIREIAPPASRTIALALPAGKKTGPAARRFAQFAEAWVRDNA